MIICLKRLRMKDAFLYLWDDGVTDSEQSQEVGDHLLGLVALQEHNQASHDQRGVDTIYTSCTAMSINTSFTATPVNTSSTATSRHIHLHKL